MNREDAEVIDRVVNAPAIGATTPDDFAPGKLYVLLGPRKNPTKMMPYSGQAVKVIEVCIPFIVVELSHNGERTTLDTRHVAMRECTQAFYNAQNPRSGQNQNINDPQAEAIMNIVSALGHPRRGR